MRPSSFSAFQCADGVNRESRDGGKFLLREAGRFAVRFELRAERPRGARLHGPVILLPLHTHNGRVMEYF
jgi:hypothetical protein